eukprot:s231_g2.t1
MLTDCVFTLLWNPMPPRSKTWKVVVGLVLGVWSWTSAFIAPQNAHRIPLSRSIRHAQVKAEEGGWCPYGLVGDMKSDYYQRHLDADFIKNMKDSSLFVQAAQEDAKEENMTVEDYLKSVLELANKFCVSDEIEDREEFIKAIEKAIQTNVLALILGGKSVGKSTIVERLVRKMRNEKTTNRTLLLSDMRDYPSKDYFKAVLTEASNQQSLLKTVWNAIKKTFKGLTANIQANAVPGVSLALKDMTTEEKEATLAEVISELKGDGITIIIDEANLALPADQNADQMDIKTAKAALAQITKITKQSNQASVILISSEHGYPYKLALAGLNLLDIGHVIIAPEVPPRFMYKLFVEKWQMGERLAPLLLSVCGGSINFAMQALRNFRMNGQQFYPLGFVDVPGIGTCLVKDDAREHLINIAVDGFSPVMDFESDEGAQIVSEKNVGGIVPRKANKPGLWEEVFQETEEKFVLIASTHHIRLMICEALLYKGFITSENGKLKRANEWWQIAFNRLQRFFG